MFVQFSCSSDIVASLMKIPQFFISDCSEAEHTQVSTTTGPFTPNEMINDIIIIICFYKVAKMSTVMYLTVKVAES